MNQPYTVYLVLPAYNESLSIDPLFSHIAATMGTLPLEIILVNDGSVDDTSEQAVAKAQQYGLTLKLVEHPKNKGLGQTVRTGLMTFLSMAQPHDIAVMMDCDNTQPPALMHDFVKKIQNENADIVIASRYQQGAAVKGLSGFRLMLSGGASALFQVFTPVPGVRDYTCGYRGYSYDILNRLVAYYGEEGLFTETGFSCMADIILKTRPLKAKIAEVPMVLRYDNRVSQSKMKIAKTIGLTLQIISRHMMTPPKPNLRYLQEFQSVTPEAKSPARSI